MYKEYEFIYNEDNQKLHGIIDLLIEKEDKMIIQINTCSGNYDIKISNKIVTYDDNSNDVPYEVIGGLQGRKTCAIHL